MLSSHSRSNNILLITNSEYGQASVFIALAYELCTLTKHDTDSEFHIHIASFDTLEPRISHLQQLLESVNKGLENRVHFQPLPGIGHMDKLWSLVGGAKGLSHPPGLRGALNNYQQMDACMAPWTVEEYGEQLTVLEQIITNTDPIAILVDNMYKPGTDICEKMGKEYLVLSPNTGKEYAGNLQPYGQGLWKYPVVSSGLAYPVPWYLIPLNIYLTFRLALYVAFSPRVKRIIEFRKEMEIPSSFFEFYKPDITYLIASFPEADFPFVLPQNVISCGPMVLPARPVIEQDPSLAKWLDERETVMINLGSHVTSDTELTRELAGGIRIFLSRNPNVQVLWKLKAQGEVYDTLRDLVGKEMDEGQVKVVSWLEVEPYAILEHENMVCSVHHGGANSYFEAVKAGVPQIVMPVWLDTYDFARRVEFLEIGVYGSKTSAPGADAEEFGQALLRVVGVSGVERGHGVRQSEAMSESKAFRRKALELSRLGMSYTGRKKAAEVVLNHIVNKRA
ncbi:UDP-Glycosyltransferase/glycogen phosphorylase [Dendrothele bispora CBS 962.96]|uniref:UDP-Glycosyltransferase/glycogen phosphorylase n=1 Tax=Dendrothele bispora (strain CBS 962.96) TaxID=1314807 RepID=A0A4S8LT07_DENBC|nr:UDP-Glycosyltransferase/glycogen phosphorylase [Dendrothele bispora CBS 962.96]